MLDRRPRTIDLMNMGLKWLILVLLSAGCAADTRAYIGQGKVSRQPGDLIDMLSGPWQVVIEVSGDCPDDWGVAFPHGRTRWRDTGRHLIIEQVGGGPALELYARDESTLYLDAVIEGPGCTLTDRQTLTPYDVNEDYAHGLFEQTLVRSGPNCEALAGGSIPGRCARSVRWQAYR